MSSEEITVEAANDAGLLYGRNLFDSGAPCGWFADYREARTDWLKSTDYRQGELLREEVLDAFRDSFLTGFIEATCAKVRK